MCCNAYVCDVKTFHVSNILTFPIVADLFTKYWNSRLPALTNIRRPKHNTRMPTSILCYKYFTSFSSTVNTTRVFQMKSITRVLTKPRGIGNFC